MNTLASSPSIADGFSGARDAAILLTSDPERDAGIAHVQATDYTSDLLKRAGIQNLETHRFYQVAIVWDEKFSRYQLAPTTPDAAADTAQTEGSALKASALGKLKQAIGLMDSAREDMANLEGSGYCKKYERLATVRQSLISLTCSFQHLKPPTGVVKL
jgi:hypothetical protein